MNRCHVHFVQDFGWVALFSSNILLFVLLVLYVALGVRENHHTRKEKNENSKLNIQAVLLLSLASVFRIEFIKKVLVIFKRLFRKREDGSHVWIITMVGVLCLMQFFRFGSSS